MNGSVDRVDGGVDRLDQRDHVGRITHQAWIEVELNQTHATVGRGGDPAVLGAAFEALLAVLCQRPHLLHPVVERVGQPRRAFRSGAATTSPQCGIVELDRQQDPAHRSLRRLGAAHHLDGGHLDVGEGSLAGRVSNASLLELPAGTTEIGDHCFQLTELRVALGYPPGRRIRGRRCHDAAQYDWI